MSNKKILSLILLGIITMGFLYSIPSLTNLSLESGFSQIMSKKIQPVNILDSTFLLSTSSTVSSTTFYSSIPAWGWVGIGIGVGFVVVYGSYLLCNYLCSSDDNSSDTFEVVYEDEVSIP